MSPNDVCCLDNDNEQPKLRLSDDQVWQQIREMVNVTNSSAFQHLADNTKRTILKDLKEKGASHRQLERLEQREKSDARNRFVESRQGSMKSQLTGVGRGLIQKL